MDVVYAHWGGKLQSGLLQCLHKTLYHRMRDGLLVCIVVITLLNTITINSLKQSPPKYRSINTVNDNDYMTEDDGVFMRRIAESRDHVVITGDKTRKSRDDTNGNFHDLSRDDVFPDGKFQDFDDQIENDALDKSVANQNVQALPNNLSAVKAQNEELVIYNIKFNKSKACKSMKRPKPEEVSKYKGYYHYFTGVRNESAIAYVLNTYYDDRLRGSDGIFIRTVAASTFDLVKRDVYSAVWYPGVSKSLFSKCHVFLGPGPNAANGALYGFRRFTISCPIPDQQLIMPPEFVSLSIGRCRKPTNYIPVVIPAPKDPSEPFKIGNCMQSLYGNFTEEFALMFVNWIETITMYGISEVTVNLNEFNNTEFGEKVLQYYKDKGILTVTQYPDIVPENSPIRQQTVAKIQSFIMLPFVDCFFKNMYRYWYFAPLDVDELYVIDPKYKTYQDYLRRYLFVNATHRNSIYLQPWVAGYYLNYRPSNLTVPKHFPMFRYTKRDELKLPGLTGHKKSFQNPKTCIYTGYHACRPLRQEDLHCPSCGYRQVMLPPDEIVLNHYRSYCKIKDNCLQPEESIYDEGVLAGATGQTIKERVTSALTDLGYLKSE